jgi:integrase
MNSNSPEFIWEAIGQADEIADTYFWGQPCVFEHPGRSTTIRPQLKAVGLEWIDLHVMRRTYSSFMREKGVDPKIVAHLMGHDLDTNLNTYTQTSMNSWHEAVKTL